MKGKVIGLLVLLAVLLAPQPPHGGARRVLAPAVTATAVLGAAGVPPPG